MYHHQNSQAIHKWTQKAIQLGASCVQCECTAFGKRVLLDEVANDIGTQQDKKKMWLNAFRSITSPSPSSLPLSHRTDRQPKKKTTTESTYCTLFIHLISDKYGIIYEQKTSIQTSLKVVHYADEHTTYRRKPSMLNKINRSIQLTFLWCFKNIVASALSHVLIRKAVCCATLFIILNEYFWFINIELQVESRIYLFFCLSLCVCVCIT